MMPIPTSVNMAFLQEACALFSPKRRYKINMILSYALGMRTKAVMGEVVCSYKFFKTQNDENAVSSL